MPSSRKMALLHGSWATNYHLATVATLNEDQANLLIGIPKSGGRDVWDQWYNFEPRDLMVILDYPLDKPIKVLIPAEEYTRPSGLASFGMFLLAVARKYEELYQAPQRYGIWGHGIGDLYFEMVTVGKDGGVKLFIGS